METITRRAPYRRSAFDNRKLTSRDIEILHAVYRHRLLHTEHVKALFGSDHVRKRLTFLNHNGYLDWPHAQRALHYDGMKHSIYGISDAGAALLAETHGIEGRDFSERNRALKPWSLPHTLLLADILVSLEMAVRRVRDRGDRSIRFLDPETLALRGGSRGHDPGRISVPVREGNTTRTLRVIPDAIVGLALSDGSGSWEKEKMLFVEADRATEPNVRGRGELSSIHRKILTYEAYAKAKGHVAQFGIDNFRVLFLTSAGEDRIVGMFEAMQRQTAPGGSGSGRYLFGLRQQLDHDDLLFDALGRRQGRGGSSARTHDQASPGPGLAPRLSVPSHHQASRQGSAGTAIEGPIWPAHRYCEWQ